jgi:hypothetical protein
MVTEGPEEGRPAQVNELTPLTGHPGKRQRPVRLRRGVRLS